MNDETPRYRSYGRQTIDSSDIAAVTEVLQGDWLSSGPLVQQFEKALCSVLGSIEVVVCSSGTAALHLALAGLGVSAGDAILVPALTFAATASVGVHVRADVVLVDIDPVTGLITEETLSEAIAFAKRQGLRPKVVMPVHYAGQVADISALARREHLLIIEDACHALGSTFADTGDRERIVGDCASADAVVFSFHPLKTITTGEGGAIATSDRMFASRLRALRNNGMTKEPSQFVFRAESMDGEQRPNEWYYEIHEAGFNYRLTDIQCALGISQLRRLPLFVEERRALMRTYRTLARGVDDIQFIKEVPWCNPAWHLCVALIDFQSFHKTRAAVMAALRQKGIGTQVHYVPLYRQPYLRQLLDLGRFRGTEQFYARALTLPLYVGLTDAQVQYVMEQLASVLDA